MRPISLPSLRCGMQVMGAASHSKLLITSRVDIKVPTKISSSTVSLGPMSNAAAAQLLTSLVEGLSQTDAAAVAAKCGGVPLLLRLVGVALSTSRRTVEVGRCSCGCREMTFLLDGRHHQWQYIYCAILYNILCGS